MNLQNKTVVITGASDGLGKEIALKLAKEKTNLILIARTAEKLAAVEKECVSLGAVSVKSFPIDLKNTAELKKVAEQIKTVDVLINNAGIWQKKGQLDEINEGVIDDVINTNLTALIHITQLLLPGLKKQPEAAIINISSRSGVTTPSGQSVYVASKWGVAGFTGSLKEDLKETNVKVAGIYQGGVNTQMFNKTGEEFSEEKLNSFISPADLAEVVVFMLSRPEKIWLHDVRVEN